MPRPGVMLYFDAFPPMGYLTNEQKGLLLEAILSYAQDGVAPDFTDPFLCVAWSFLKKSIDRDGERYEERISKTKYAAYCREAKKLDLPAASFEEWKELSEAERKNLLCNGDG